MAMAADWAFGHLNYISTGYT
ncbi:hypothetical protein CCACVL1_18427 [Corchorus capsularis]|uniref:Uncharacterized protein n=1 Tax=Corchorus capsularis TaxID=210143 RepID=A0A1R3HLI0_COCAP|nr:hypothetical protein CCACVL1_18427 [Corchorus capsularis]